MRAAGSKAVGSKAVGWHGAAEEPDNPTVANEDEVQIRQVRQLL